MKSYKRSHLADQTLATSLAASTARACDATADQLADMAEFDARKLYLPAAYPSMHAYCVAALGLSEDAASKRIHAARTARRFPAIFGAVSEGRLHLSGVCLLAPHLREENAAELLTAAMRKSKAEIERMLASRFPRPDVLPWVASSAAAATAAHAPGHAVAAEHAPGHVDEPAMPGAVAVEHAPGHTNRSVVKPLSSQSFEVQFTIGASGHDKLGYLTALLSHEIPSGETATVIERALDLAIAVLEKRKFAAGSRPRRGAGRSLANPRTIPAEVRQAVWKRDGGRCTFVSESGQRCTATEHLEFDHILEVARGGESTVDNLRLLCRAHNQYAAEQTFGAEFMRNKREAARERAQERRARASAVANPKPKREWDPDRDVEPWLNALGVRGDDLARGAAAAATIPDARLEERVRFALRTLTRGRAPRGAGQGAPGITAAA